MNEQQRTLQMQAIHIDYKHKIDHGVLPPLHASAREGCHIWATEVLGRLVPSLKTCSDFELNVLRDRLNGKPTKLIERARAEVERVGIKDIDKWIAACAARSESFRRWQGCTLETLPISQLYRLVKILERRKPARSAHSRA